VAEVLVIFKFMKPIAQVFAAILLLGAMVIAIMYGFKWIIGGDPDIYEIYRKYLDVARGTLLGFGPLGLAFGFFVVWGLTGALTGAALNRFAPRVLQRAVIPWGIGLAVALTAISYIYCWAWFSFPRPEGCRALWGL
jgi:hypothetical protein